MKATLIFRKSATGDTLVFGVLPGHPMEFPECAALVDIDVLKTEDRREEHEGKSYPFLLGTGIRPVDPKGTPVITFREACEMVDGKRCPAPTNP